MKYLLLVVCIIIYGCEKSIKSRLGSVQEAYIDSSIVDNLDSSKFTYLDVKEKYISDPNNYLPYTPRGIGGGGAFSGLSISPYSSLWFVGTDMGTLFRSTNYGKNWYPVSHFQTRFSSDLSSSVPVGFSSNPKIVFHAAGGVNPVRSIDAGLTFKPIEGILLDKTEKILYWRSNTFKKNEMFIGTTKGLFKSDDEGLNFFRIPLPVEEAIATYIDYLKDSYYIYHVTENGIYKSIDEGRSFKRIYTPLTFKIRKFSAGRDQFGVTFAFVDNNGANACKNMFDITVLSSEWQDHIKHCGYLWIAHDEVNYKKTKYAVGDHLALAENSSKTIYFTGSKKWIKQYGTKIYVSNDSGINFNLVFNQLDWDVVPFRPWPKEKLEYSAVALDIGWWDSGYENFSIHLRNPNIVGGTGNFFVHVSYDGGKYWKAPFTKFSDSGERSSNKKWSSTGLEVNSIYKFVFHPNNSKLGYAGAADIGGLVTEDGGKTFRITKVPYNSIYDYSFDLNKNNVVYAAAGEQHDFPSEWHGHVTNSIGGILKSNDFGKTWIDLTANSKKFQLQYLSLVYDFKNEIIYGGTQGYGIVFSKDGGSSFEFLNEGLPKSHKIIPRIILDPVNQDLYCLVTGDAPYFSNSDQTGIYYLKSGTTEWVLLRNNLIRPEGLSEDLKLWYYPIDFAIDFYSNSERKTMYLVDYENNNNWLSTGIWKTSDRGETWSRLTQYTHPLSIVINPEHPNELFVNGFWSVDSNWGNGGAFFSRDSGQTWKKNLLLPYQSNGRSTTIDPNSKNNLFYTFFGNSMLYGPKPY